MAQQFTIKWNGNNADITKVAVDGLVDASEYLLDESLKLVPIDESTLANSGNTSVDKGALQAAVYFDTPYAVRQHEDLTLRHSNGRKAKYLETPFKSHQNKLIEMIARRINRKIGDK